MGRKLLIVGTQRYSINMCDFHMFYKNTSHEIVETLHHVSTAYKDWFHTGIYNGKSRNKLVSKLSEHKLQGWSSNSELLKKINIIDFDYICIGNGNDDTGKLISKEYNGKVLYSEYGWLPWNTHFYIDNEGVGPQSSIAKMNVSNIAISEATRNEISDLKESYNEGTELKRNDYVYVPLQVDAPTSDGKPDFKFQYTKFKSNKEFLQHVKSIVPKDVLILVKNHPSNPKPTPVPDGMIDISNLKYNKKLLYENMLGMICMNSTSVLEGILFNRPVFTYGTDLFSNKGIVFENATKEDVAKVLGQSSPTTNNGENLIALLLQRQICRHRCQNSEYVRDHYWNTAIY